MGCPDCFWNAREIDDERNWKGENRLGRCHDEACKIFNRMEEKQKQKKDWEGEAPVSEERLVSLEPSAGSREMSQRCHDLFKH